MRKLSFNPEDKKTHNGWQSFLKSLRIGDYFEIPGLRGRERKFVSSRASNIRYMAKNVGIVVETESTNATVLARRIK